MEGFFKSFGKGLLYILVLPFFLIIISFFAIAGLFVFIYLFIASIVLFFMGRSLDIELPEDKKAKEIMNSLNAEHSPSSFINEYKNNNDKENNDQTNDEMTMSSFDNRSIEKACFEDEDVTIQANDIRQPNVESSFDIINETINDEVEVNCNTEEILAMDNYPTYKPNSSNFHEIKTDTIEEEQSIGVDIDYKD